MKISDQIKVRRIAGEYIMITEANGSLDYTKAISLNDTAAYLVEQVIDQEFSIDTWVDLLVKRYEVDEQTARQDSISLLEVLNEAGAIEGSVQEYLSYTL